MQNSDLDSLKLVQTKYGVPNISGEYVTIDDGATIQTKYGAPCVTGTEVNADQVVVQTKYGVPNVSGEYVTIDDGATIQTKYGAPCVTSIEVSDDDAEALANLPDEDIVLNVSSVDDLCSTWLTRANSLNLTIERANSSFSAFTSYGILVDYIKNLSIAVDAVIVNVTQIKTKILSSKDGQVNIDKIYSSDDGSNSNYDGYDTGNATNTDSSSSTQVNNSNSNNLVNDGASTDSSISGVSFNEQDYLAISAVLLGLASSNNKLVNDLLSDTTQGTVIKEKLLGTPGVSDDTKKVIASIEPDILLKVLSDLNKNGKLNCNVSEDSVKYLYNYLDRVASLNGINVNELLNKTEYNDVLKSSLEGYSNTVNYFDNISNESVISIRSDLLKIYDGESISNLDKNTVESVRCMLDVLSGEKDTSYEYLLNNGNEIKNAINAVSQSKEFVNDLAKMDINEIKVVVGSLVGNKS